MAIDWTTIDKAKGNGDITLGVSANANAATSSRNARIKITSTDGSIVKYVSVIQEGKEDYLNASAAGISHNYTASTGPAVIKITSNMSWTLEYPDWISVSPTSGNGDGEFNVIFTENTTGEDRMDVITVKGATITKYITVGQFKEIRDHHLDIEPTTLTFNGDGGELSFIVYSDAVWSVTSPTSWTIIGGEYVKDWLTLDKTNGNCSEKVKVKVPRSEVARDVEITVSVIGSDNNPTISKTVRVFQSKDETVEYLEVSPSNIEFDYDGGDDFITITASGSWSITTPDWIEVTTNSGDGDKTLSVKADKSTLGSDRSGVITITMGNRSATVNVIQRYTGKLTISQSSVVFLYTGTAYQRSNITVSSTGAWTSSKTDDWFSMNKTSGSSGDTNIYFTAQSWSGTEPRSGKVNFYLDGLLKATAVIFQLQQSFETTIIEYTKSVDDGDGAVEPNIPDVFGVPIIANLFDYTEDGDINQGQYYVAGTVKEVKANGFKNCLLSSIVLPDTVEKIGDYAFMNTRLTYFKYPSSTYDVGVGAFMNTKKMVNVVTNNLVTEIKDYTFFNSKLDGNYLGECFLGKNITKIGNNAFSYNALRRLIIPAKMQEISKNAFVSAFDERNVKPMMCFTGAKPLVKSNGVIADVGGFTDIGGLRGTSGLLTHFPTYDYSSWFQGDSSFVKQNWNNRSYDSSNEINYVTTDGGLAYPILKIKNVSLDDTFDNYYYYWTNDIPDFFGNILISNTYNGKGKWVFTQEIKSIGRLFENNTKVKEIELPNSVLTLGFSSFSSSYDDGTTTDSKNIILEVIKLGNGVQEVSALAFDSLPNLTDIYITTVTAPRIDGTPSTIDRSNIVLHYPSGSDYSTWIEKFGFTGVADL